MLQKCVGPFTDVKDDDTFGTWCEKCIEIGVDMPIFRKAKARVAQLEADARMPTETVKWQRSFENDTQKMSQIVCGDVAKMFGMKVDSNKKPYPNLLGNAGIEHFTVHDLRRTCCSLLAAAGVASDISERCLNHKIQGTKGIYDRHDYLEERKNALNVLSDNLSKIEI